MKKSIIHHKNYFKNNELYTNKLSIGFIVFGLSIHVLVLMLFFVIITKIKQEFYFSNNVNSQNSSIDLKQFFYFKERDASLEVFINNNHKNNLNFLFNDGLSFNYNDDLYKYLKIKRKKIIVTHMMSRHFDPVVSRIKIFTREKLTYNEQINIINLFSKFGFDDFDFEVKS